MRKKPRNKPQNREKEGKREKTVKKKTKQKKNGGTWSGTGINTGEKRRGSLVAGGLKNDFPWLCRLEIQSTEQQRKSPFSALLHPIPPSSPLSFLHFVTPETEGLRQWAAAQIRTAPLDAYQTGTLRATVSLCGGRKKLVPLLT